MLDVRRIRERFGCHGVAATDAGVLTASDATFFPGLQLLVASLGRTVPLTIVDLGLTDEQSAWCSCHQARRVAVDLLPMPCNVKMWQGWNKPFFICRSPFRRTLWIDADCVVVGDLQPLLRQLNETPFVVRHWDFPYPQPNKEWLYDRYPVRTRFSRGRGINSGVVGIDLRRDADLLENWCEMVSRAVLDPKIRSAVSWYDEGALHWALEATEQIDCVVAHQGWNRFVPSRVTDDPVGYILSISAQPDDVIWHFSGSTKPWLS
jgi:hypothetical protein